jgi:Domain of unknown function (DUF927)
MSTNKFLDTILPPDAWSAIVVPEGEYWRHTWISPEQRASGEYYLPPSATHADKAYFSCAGYQQTGTDWAGRTKANTHSVRALWLDIDAGAEKLAKHGDAVYETQDAALSALVMFCKTDFFTPTYVVDSGNGLHAYWAFNEAIPAKLWTETVAPRFAQLCADAGLKVDRARTCDPASILRLPGSKAGGKRVSVVHEGLTHPIEVLAAKLPKVLNGAGVKFAQGPAVTTLVPYKAAWVIRKAVAGEGCAQLQELFEARGNVAEPVWRAGLSVIAHGADGDEAIDELLMAASDGHPSFSAVATRAKAGETRGPYTCASWETVNPAPCMGCRFKIAARSPCRFGYEENASKWELAAMAGEAVPSLPKGMMTISLASMQESNFGQEGETGSLAPGAVIDAEEPEAPVLTYEEWLDAHPRLTTFKLVDGKSTKYVVGGTANDQAKYLVGQWRAVPEATEWTQLFPAELSASSDAQKFGITRVARNAEGIISTVVVCESTVVPNAIVVTSSSGATAPDVSGQLVVDYYSAIGQGSLSIATAKYSAGSRGEALSAMMGNIGVILDTAGLKGFLMYLQTAAATIVSRRGNVEQAIAMGWTAKDSFVLGAKNYMPDGSVRGVSLSDAFKHFATIGTTAGTLDEWNSLLEGMYVTGDAADMPLQFAILAGFGAPVHSRGQDIGGVIHLFSGASAAGKTTVQRVIAAIYDAPKGPANHPTMLIAAKTDTTKARTHKLGMLNSLALLNDEITEMNPQEIAAFIYTSTQGRANDRMASDSNRLRDNNTNWGAYTVTSGNRRLSDSYGKIMQDSEGMAKRVWEIEVPAVRVAGGLAKDARLVEPLLAGAVYGVAGTRWIKWLVSNWAAVAARKVKMIEQVVLDAGLTRADRFFANMAASALVAGQCAATLGLHPFDMKALYAYVINTLKVVSTSTADADKTVATIKLFITRNLNRVSRIDQSGAFMLMLSSPHGGVIGVFDQRDSTLAISEGALLEASVLGSGSPAEMRRTLRKLGVVKQVKIAADPLVPLTDCFVIDTGSAHARTLAIGHVSKDVIEGVV